MRIIGEVWPLIGFVLLGISIRPGHNAAPLSDGSSPNSNNGPQKYELDQRPVGAGFRVFPKTGFSCLGRPAGYYADVDTGCEIYHMCDGLGRQFAYACPNATLFQQRMLICDHWYMVNCSRALNDYGANLLIGQRDKPFVADEENELRTPRPDLSDRPYASDYSGESYRKHYKISQVPAFGNSIAFDSKSSSVQEVIAPIHWGTPNTYNTLEGQPQERRKVRDESQNQIVIRRIDEVPEPTQQTQESRNPVNGVLILPSPSGFSKPIITKSEDVSANVKVPSILYELPFFHPDFAETKAEEQEPKKETRSPADSQQNEEILLKSATTVVPKKAPPSPSGFAKSFESPNNDFTAKHKEYDFSKYQKKGGEVKKPVPITTTTTTTEPPTTTTQRPTTTTRTTTTTRSTTTTPRPTTTVPPTTTQIPLEIQAKIANQDAFLNTIQSSIPLPAIGLEPPFTEYKTYDDSTTEGPPIYYEWKWAVPAFVLEPPKLTNDPPKTADDDKPPTARSIFSAAGNFANSDLKFNTHFLRKKIALPENNFSDLKKTFLIPTFDFPLDGEARTAFVPDDDAVNSYQLKIPSDVSRDRPWYGENKDCPDCHPAFLQPGTCEPCIRRRR